jgi:hypothetical protein
MIQLESHLNSTKKFAEEKLEILFWRNIFVSRSKKASHLSPSCRKTKKNHSKMFSKNEEKSFDTLEEMVHYFRRIPLIPVTTDEEVLLGRAWNPEKVIDNAFFSKFLLIKDAHIFQIF